MSRPRVGDSLFSRDSPFRIGLFSNTVLVGAVLLTFAMQMAVIYLPPPQNVFRTEALPWPDLLFCLILSTAVFRVAKLEKLAFRARSKAA